MIPLIFFALLAAGVIKRPVRSVAPVNLLMWVVTDDPLSYADLTDSYAGLRPYISVTIERVPKQDYSQRLKDAWARGRGPDIFELPASSIGEFTNDFILPIPPTTTVYNYQRKKILLRTETEITPVTVPSVTPTQIQRDFADVVYEDVVRDGKIYGLPLSLDTLVLYYNRDLLRSANIAEPPKSWTGLVNAVPRLTSADEDGKILQSAIPLGTGSNIDHAADIMSLLMLQSGVRLQTPEGEVMLDSTVLEDGTNVGQRALDFYTSFANPAKKSYAWNAAQSEARESFIREKSAMYLGYGYERNEIAAEASMNFDLAPIPHLQEDGKDALVSGQGNPLQVNFGNYWVLSVFQRTAYPQEAWNFVQFIAKQPDVARAYLDTTSRVGALRSILQEQQEEDQRGILASQAISARSWYHGRDATRVTQYLKDMIDGVVLGKNSISGALELARRQIELTTKRPR